MAIAYFVGCVRSSTPNSKLDIGKVIVQSVQFIVQTGVLGICSLSTFRVWRKTCVIGTVIEILLRRPLVVVGHEVDFALPRLLVDRALERDEFCVGDAM